MASRSLSLWMNGERVGLWTKSNGDHELTYDAPWVTSSQGRPLSLSLPFLPGGVPHRGERVVSYFENLLPDRPEVRNRLRDRFRASSAQAFDLLAEVGRDCVGALQLLPEDAAPPTVRTIEGLALSDSEIEGYLGRAAGIPFPGWDRDDFRISLAGAQEKTAFLRKGKAWFLPRGATPSTHIFKLPLGGLGGLGTLGAGSVENEWLCSRILEAFRLPVARTEMGRFGSQTVLIVERFDRRLSGDETWWLRLPVEDFCQVRGLPPEKKYESDGGPGIDTILEVLRGSSSADEDRIGFFQAQVAFWLLAASDGHAKNFSVFLDAGGRFRLTPLYDVLSMYPWMGTSGDLIAPQKLRMAMAVRGQSAHYHWGEIQRRHWEQTGQRHGLGKAASRVLDEVVDRTPEVIRTVEDQLPQGFPETLAGPIFEGLRRGAQRLRGKD